MFEQLNYSRSGLPNTDADKEAFIAFIKHEAAYGTLAKSVYRNIAVALVTNIDSETLFSLLVDEAEVKEQIENVLTLFDQLKNALSAVLDPVVINTCRQVLSLLLRVIYSNAPDAEKTKILNLLVTISEEMATSCVLCKDEQWILNVDDFNRNIFFTVSANVKILYDEIEKAHEEKRYQELLNLLGSGRRGKNDENSKITYLRKIFEIMSTLDRTWRTINPTQASIFADLVVLQLSFESYGRIKKSTVPEQKLIPANTAAMPSFKKHPPKRRKIKSFSASSASSASALTPVITPEFSFFSSLEGGSFNNSFFNFTPDMAPLKEATAEDQSEITVLAKELVYSTQESARQNADINSALGEAEKIDLSFYFGQERVQQSNIAADFLPFQAERMQQTNSSALSMMPAGPVLPFATGGGVHPMASSMPFFMSSGLSQMNATIDLSDPDIIKLMEQARLVEGTDFTPIFQSVLTSESYDVVSASFNLKKIAQGIEEAIVSMSKRIVNFFQQTSLMLNKEFVIEQISLFVNFATLLVEQYLQWVQQDQRENHLFVALSDHVGQTMQCCKNFLAIMQEQCQNIPQTDLPANFEEIKKLVDPLIRLYATSSLFMRASEQCAELRQKKIFFADRNKLKQFQEKLIVLQPTTTMSPSRM